MADYSGLARRIVAEAGEQTGIDLTTYFVSRDAKPEGFDRVAVKIERAVGQHFDTLLPPFSLPDLGCWDLPTLISKTEDLISAEAARDPATIASW